MRILARRLERFAEEELGVPPRVRGGAGRPAGRSLGPAPAALGGLLRGVGSRVGVPAAPGLRCGWRPNWNPKGCPQKALMTQSRKGLIPLS